MSRHAIFSFVTVCGRRLEVERIPAAREGLPTLVFLHEGLGSVSMWRHFPAAVSAATGCETVVYSRYGYGKSDSLQERRRVDYMHREALEALPELLSKLEIERPVLVGHSDGGSIAIICAGANHRARGLALLAPHVFVEDISIQGIAAAKDAFRSTDLSGKLARHHADAERTFWGWNELWLHPDFRRWNIEEYLPRIDCPVLAVQGYEDAYGTMAQLDAIERQVKSRLTLVKLERCGHSPHRDQPEATLAAVADFVRSV